MVWKTILPKRFVLIAVTFLSLASMLTACGGDRREYSYKTLADAGKAGEIKRGWLPDDLIPSSSCDIRLVEELSPSHEWCAFDFIPADAENLRKNLKNVYLFAVNWREGRAFFYWTYDPYDSKS